MTIGDHSTTSVTTTNLQKKGTLTIEIVDRATNKIVWRASASDTVSKVKDIPKKIAKAIKKMFKKFPPK